MIFLTHVKIYRPSTFYRKVISYVTAELIFNCFSLFINRLTPLVDLGLSTDNLPDGLQHLNCGYPGYTTYYSLWQRDEDEKWRNVSSFVG